MTAASVIARVGREKGGTSDGRGGSGWSLPATRAGAAGRNVDFLPPAVCLVGRVTRRQLPSVRSPLRGGLSISILARASGRPLRRCCGAAHRPVRLPPVAGPGGGVRASVISLRAELGGDRAQDCTNGLKTSDCMPFGHATHDGAFSGPNAPIIRPKRETTDARRG